MTMTMVGSGGGLDASTQHKDLMQQLRVFLQGKKCSASILL
jgi:hypothetical protein